MSNSNQKLYELAFELCKLMDKGADAALPREIADVVKTHAKIAVASSAAALIPGVGSTASIAAAAAAIWGMYIRINSKLGLKLSENVIKTIASGVATNLAGYAAASVAAGAVLSFFPGAAVPVMAAVQYALTITSGYVYLKVLIALSKNKVGISEGSMNSAVNTILKDKSTIKSFFNEVKSNYKK